MLKKILTSNNIIESIENNLNELLILIPELRFMIGFKHKNPHHHLDVWEHTLYALSLSENDFEIRLCLLLHDIGKPFSYQEGNIRHYNGHALKSYEISKKIFDRFDFNEKFKEEVCYLIKNHDTPISKKDIEDNYNLCVKRYKIQVCDSLAHNPIEIKRRVKYLNKVKTKLKENQ